MLELVRSRDFIGSQYEADFREDPSFGLVIKALKGSRWELPSQMEVEAFARENPDEIFQGIIAGEVLDTEEVTMFLQLQGTVPAFCSYANFPLSERLRAPARWLLKRRDAA